MIAIADLDMISEQFFEMRRQKIENLDFDNVTFVLNCVDVLAGDEAFVALRKKRLKHRTLTRLEAADEAVHRRVPEARPRRPRTRPRTSSTRPRRTFDKQVEPGPEPHRPRRADQGDHAAPTLQEVANRRLEVEKANIEDTKRRTIHESKAESERNDPPASRTEVRSMASPSRRCRR